MRRILTALVVLLCASPVSAAPFAPTEFLLEALDAIFVSSGTGTLCANCEDSDLLNDVTATILPFQSVRGEIQPLPTFWPIFAQFSIHTNAATLPFSVEEIEIPIRVTLFDPSPEYPLPSVTYAKLTGQLLIGFEDSFFVTTCCEGEANGVIVVPAFPPLHPPSPYPFPGSTLNIVYMDIHVQPPMEYTPMPVPEPGTLFLFGTGIAAFVRYRRGSVRSVRLT